MADINVAETVDLVVGSDTLVVLVILVEAVGSLYEEIVVGGTDILYLVVGEIILPGAYLSDRLHGEQAA
jgi:hypothetical protein